MSRVLTDRDPGDEAQLSDGSKLFDWRMTSLRSVGYSPSVARKIAGCRSVDLHEACDLVSKGCPEELAMRILL